MDAISRRLKMVDYLEIKIKNKHAIIKTVNNSDMYTIPFDKIKIIDENDKVLVNRKKKEKTVDNWILRKIIIDDPGKASDGSDAKIHSDVVFKGTLKEMQNELIKRDILLPKHSMLSPSSWKKIVTGKGYLLYPKKEG